MKAERDVLVYYARDEREAEQIVIFLKANGIEASRRELGKGAYRDIYAGNSVYGEEVFVKEDAEEKARLYLESYLKKVEDPEKRQKLQEKKDKRQKRGILVFALVLLLALIFLLAATWLPR